jgi:hypothetical protein
MNLLIFLLLLLVVLIIVFRGRGEHPVTDKSVTGGEEDLTTLHFSEEEDFPEEDEIVGAKEVRVNRPSKKGKIIAHTAKNLKSFVDKATFKFRLVYVTGADLSGRTHLAKMIAKKHGYEYLDERENGKVISAPDMRKKFFLDVTGKTASEREKQRDNAKKYVLSGCWGAHDLKRIFKGEPINKNVSIIFVKPDPEKAAAWSKVSKKPKDDFKQILSESEKLFKELSTSFLLNVVINRYADLN